MDRPQQHQGNFLTVPEGGGLPMVIIMCEAGEARKTAVITLLLPLPLLPLFLPAADLIVELSLVVHFLHGLSVAQMKETLDPG